MGKAQTVKAERRLWKVLSLDDRADIAERTGAASLLYCDHPWALRHSFVNHETGEVIRARCNRWDCLHCGPRKVDIWRQLVKQAEPVLFLTLTKAGKTVEQAARALTTFIQALRRGSKGHGQSHIGARAAYLIEYFAVLEKHRDFARNGFHWHLSSAGANGSIPYKEVIKPLWESATHFNPETGEGAEIGWIQRVRNARAIGYVTKYLMKSLTTAEVGTRQVERERLVTIEDSEGDILGFERQREMVEVASKAHRIRYSREFFPERVAALWKRLFEGMEHTAMEGSEPQNTGHGKPLEEEEEKQGSPWELVKRGNEDERVDVEDYKRRRYAELVVEIEEVRETDPKEYVRLKRLALAQLMKEVRELVQGWYGTQRRKVLIEALEEDRHVSRRVISMWDYQRKQLRQAS